MSSCGTRKTRRQRGSPYYKHTYQERKTHLGPVDHHTLRALGGCARVKANLGLFLVQCGSRDEASAVFIEMLLVRKKRFRKDHPDTLRTIQGLANCTVQLKPYDSFSGYLIIPVSWRKPTGRPKSQNPSCPPRSPSRTYLSSSPRPHYPPNLLRSKPPAAILRYCAR